MSHKKKVELKIWFQCQICKILRNKKDLVAKHIAGKHRGILNTKGDNIERSSALILEVKIFELKHCPKPKNGQNSRLNRRSASTAANESSMSMFELGKASSNNKSQSQSTFQDDHHIASAIELNPPTFLNPKSQCSICQKQFTQKCYLNYHMRTKHPYPKQHRQEEDAGATDAITANVDKNSSKDRNRKNLFAQLNKSRRIRMSLLRYNCKNKKKPGLKPETTMRRKLAVSKINRSRFKCSKFIRNCGNVSQKNYHDKNQGDKCTCPCCPGISAHKAALWSNKNTENQEDNQIFNCRTCATSLDSLEELQKHRIAFHESKTTTKPQLPKKSTNQQPEKCTKPKPENSTKIQTTEKPENPSPPLFKCSKCVDWFLSSIHRDQHESSHGDKYPCSFCPTGFNSKHSRLKHINRIHEEENNLTKLKCSFCSETFSKPTYKVLHEKGHGDKYMCKLCPTGFNSKSSLANHINRIHWGIKTARPTPVVLHADDPPGRPGEWHCTYCIEIFATRSLIKQHERTHGIHYPCPFCHGIFYNSKNLLRHKKRIHAEESKINICGICGLSFPNHQFLNKHRRAVHNEMIPSKQKSQKKSVLNEPGSAGAGSPLGVVTPQESSFSFDPVEVPMSEEPLVDNIKVEAVEEEEVCVWDPPCSSTVSVKEEFFEYESAMEYDNSSTSLFEFEGVENNPLGENASENVFPKNVIKME